MNAPPSTLFDPLRPPLLLSLPAPPTPPFPHLQDDGNSLLLDWRRRLKSLLKDTHQKLPLKEEVFELTPLGSGDILGGGSSLMRLGVSY